MSEPLGGLKKTAVPSEERNVRTPWGPEEDGCAVRRTLRVQKPLPGQKKPLASDRITCFLCCAQALLKNAVFLLSFALLRIAVPLLRISR